MTIDKFYKEFAETAHSSTNHFYNEYLPYKFHLEMVNVVFHKFKHLLKDYDQLYVNVVEAAGWCHDTIEDCRITFNDLQKFHPDGEMVADIVYALTNEKGKNRHERANEKYYSGIRSIPGATYIKLCDRIANVQFGLISNSTMPLKYKQEGSIFKNWLYEPRYKDMFDYLDELYTQIK